MSLKQWLKQKLPFTRKGLEDHPDEKMNDYECAVI